MTAYGQAMKHWTNHRKDRFYQPCSGIVSERPKIDSVSKETEEKWSRESMQKILQTELNFPIYLFQNKWGIWEVVAKNHIAGAKIESAEELEAFANEYAFQDD